MPLHFSRIILYIIFSHSRENVQVQNEINTNTKLIYLYHVENKIFNEAHHNL